MKRILVLFSIVSLSLSTYAQEKKSTEDVKVPIETLKSYIGEYELGQGAVIDVTTDSNRIFIQLTNQQKIEVFATSTTEFYLKVVEAKIVFNTDDKGKAISLTLYQNGQNILAKKIK